MILPCPLRCFTTLSPVQSHPKSHGSGAADSHRVPREGEECSADDFARALILEGEAFDLAHELTIL